MTEARRASASSRQSKTGERARGRGVTADGSGTVIDVELQAELGSVASLLGPLARLSLRRGVDANLAALKTLLDVDSVKGL